MSKIITVNNLNRLWQNGVLTIKSALEKRIGNLEEAGSTVTNKLTTYDDIMTNNVEGYIPDALGVKEGFEQVNNSLGEKIEGTLTSSLSNSFAFNKCIKNGNTVQLYLKFSTSTIGVTGLTEVIANLPEEFRPTKETYVTGSVRYDNINHSCVFSINPNGNICQKFATGKVENIVINGIFIK